MARGRRTWWGVAAILAVAAAGAWLEVASLGPTREPSASARSAQRVATGRDRPASDRGAGRPSPGADPDLSRTESPAGADPDRFAELWAVVDVEKVRAAMPNNLYWQLAVPTQDPDVLQARKDERTRRNAEYGKVLAGLATEEEIHAYYAYRQRLSTDYVDFVTYVLDHYGADLPERDVGLLQLARRLHQARLAEIPRRIQEALARRQAEAR